MEAITPNYSRITEWVKTYGSSGAEDVRAIGDFMTVESHELISMVRNELIFIAQGKYSDEILDKLVGAKRRVKHGGYDKWAQLMLQWMASPQNR